MRAFALAAFGCALVTGVLAVLAGSSAGRAYLAREASGALSRRWRGDLRIGEIVSLNPWYLRVRDVEATDARGVRVAYVAAASASIDLSALLKGDLVLTHLTVRGARVSLREQDGQLAIAECFRGARPPAPTSTPSSFRFEARDARISDGHVYDLPHGIELRGVHGGLSLSYAGAFRMRAQGGQAHARWAQGRAELTLQQLALSLAAGEQSQLLARVRAGADALTVEGTLDWSEQGPGPGRARLHGQLGASGLRAAGQAALADRLRAPLAFDLEAELDPLVPRARAAGTLAAAGAALAVRVDCTPRTCSLAARSEQLQLGQVVAIDGVEPLGFELELGLSGEALREYRLAVRSARYGALVLPAFSAGGRWSPEQISVRELKVPGWFAEPAAIDVDLRATRAGDVAGRLHAGLTHVTAETGWGRFAGLRAQQLRLHASGEYHLASGALALSLALSAAALEHAEGKLEQLRVEADARGSLQQLGLSVRARASGLDAKSFRADSVELSARGGPQRYTIEVSARSGAVSGRLALALTPHELGARLSGSAQLNGVLAAPLELKLTLATLTQEALRLSALEVRTGPAQLSLSGLMHFSRASDLLLRARGLCAEQLAQLGAALPAWAAQLRGCAAGQLHAIGTPEDPGLSGQAQVLGLQFGEHALGQADLTLALQRTSRRLALGLTLGGPLLDVVGQLEGEVSLPTSGSPTARRPPRLSGQSQAGADLQSIGLASGGVRLAAGYQGRLRASARLEALAPLLQLDAARVRDVGLKVELAAEDRALRAQLDVDQAGTLLLRGTAVGHAAALSAQPNALEDLTAELELHQLPLRLLTGQPLFSTGRLDGVVRLRDMLTVAGSAELRLQLAGVQAEGVKLPMVTIAGHADAAGVHVNASAAQRGQLELEADVPWRWEGRGRLVLQEGGVRAHARLDGVPLALLLAPLPDVMEVRGSVAGVVSLEGMHEQLDLEGNLKLTQGSFTIREPFTRFERVELALALERDRLKLRLIELGDLAGKLSGEGELRLRGFTPTTGHLKLSARELPVRQEGIVVGAVSGELSAEAQLSEQPLRVQVRLRELAVQLPEHAGSVQGLEPHADVVYVNRAAPAADGARPSTEITPFEIELDASEPFWVRRPNLAVELSAKLRFRRDASGTRLRGVVNVEHGLLTLLGRGFDLQRGTLNFEGGTEIDPALSLDAVHKLGDGHTVTASVRGTLSAPVLNFTSSVPGVKTNAEALQLLASGREASAAETAQAQVGAALAGLTAGMFGKITGGKYGKYIPVLSLEAGASAGTRMRAGVEADELIPERLKGVVKGAYVEGYIGSKNQGGSRTGAGGVLMELYFPHELVTGGSWELPNNWALEVTWEP